MPFRSSLGNTYRYGYQNQEKTDEISGSGNHINFTERGYDPRLGRWWSIDKYFAKYPYQSPYAFVGNSPIFNKEIDGNDYGVYVNHDTKTIIIKATYYTTKGDKDSHTSAVAATQFWNNESGKYQYKVGNGDNAVVYDIQFQLDVKEVDNPILEATNDRSNFETGNSKLTTDGSSNTYAVLPDVDKAFINTNPNEVTSGVTIGGAVVKVKDSKKGTETGTHEVGHTLGLKHFLSGLMTPAGNDPARSTSINKFTVEGIFKNLFKPNGEAGKGTLHEEGTKPEKFNKGTVKAK
jgi:RHS repeat-associated protein